MKRFLLLSFAALMAVTMMAKGDKGDGTGTTPGNAKEFKWDTGIEHGLDVHGQPQELYYVVYLDPLYEEENPSLTLYLTNPSNNPYDTVEVSMEATVAKQKESRTYKIAGRQYKTYTANASMLVRMQQTEIVLKLKTVGGPIKVSARVFEAADLDESCTNAKLLEWEKTVTQPETYSAWWKVNLSKIKNTTDKDARITITNAGSKTVNLVMKQSLDCPASGVTERNYELAAGEQVINVVPNSMLTSVKPNELYFSVKNVEAPITIKVEQVQQPATPVIEITPALQPIHLDDTIEPLAAGTYLFYLTKAEMLAKNKYEPELTYRSAISTAVANVDVKMAFHLPAYGSSNTSYQLAPGEEEIVVYKRNMLDGLGEDVDTIYMLTTVDRPINLYWRLKHVREGKACKTNIDYGELIPTNVHTQEEGPVQWYAIYYGDASFDEQDITVYIKNEGTKAASVSASIAFDCPYIDLQDASRSIAAGATVSHKFTYAMYSAMGKKDSIWVGLTTSQPIKFWAETSDTHKKTPDNACESAKKFNWQDGDTISANTPTWFLVDMKEARKMAAKFPTIFVQNQANATAQIEAELSLECPDEYENEKRSRTLGAYESYSKQISRDMFENLNKDTVYLKVTSTQKIAIQVRMTEQEPGTICSSAVPFNWVAGNDVAANANQWISVDLHDVLKSSTHPDVILHLKNKENKACRGTAYLAYECAKEGSPEVQAANFSLTANELKSKTLLHSLLETPKDSMVWIRVVANTALHIQADTVPGETIDTIQCADIVPDTIEWNTLYTQTERTKWYVITGPMLASLKALTTTPEAYVKDLSGQNNIIKAEFAYACPITAKMQSKSTTLSANQKQTKMIERTTMKQVWDREQIYIRLTGKGAFEFKAELVNPQTGNDRNHAIEILPDSTYEMQPVVDSMWYKIDTRVWKKDKTLHGKSLHIDTRNLGGQADVRVWVYEDVSQEDLIETFTGMKDKGHRTLKAGEHRSRNIPAYAIYGLGNAELYICVKTNQPMRFTTSLTDYAPLSPALPVKDMAQLAVPNVTYNIPANEDKWYAVCVPYIRNNFTLTDSSTVDFYNMGTSDATVKVMTTWQDTLTFQVPERSRTIKAGSHYIKTFKQIVNKGLSKAGVNFDVEQTKISFIEEQLRKYLTSDSLTGYVRIWSDQPLQVRVNTPQTTGKDCGETPLMKFDWEHGNVNPKDSNTWFLLEMDSWRIPDNSAIRLHVENWSDESNAASAVLYQKCTDPLPLVDSIKYTLSAGQDKFKDINRNVLETMGWGNYIIDYRSAETSRIWIEIVPELPRDTVYADTLILACVGDTIWDEFATKYADNASLKKSSKIQYAGTKAYVIVDKAYVNPGDTLIWSDSIEFVNDTLLAMWDSIFTYKVITRQDPQVVRVDDTNRPAIKRDQAIDASATTTWLMTQYADAQKDVTGAPNDTIKTVDAIYWMWSKDGVNFDTVRAATVTPTAAIKLTYEMITGCRDTLPGDTLVYIARDTTEVTECDSYTWTAGDGLTYNETPDEFPYVTKSLGLGLDSISYLNLTIKESTTSEETRTECDSYTWNGQTYTASGDYTFTTTNAANCDSTATLHLTINKSTTSEETRTECDSYTWNGQTYTESGDYTFTTTNAVGCDSTATLHLTINKSTRGEETASACGSYEWNGQTYTATGDYMFTTTNAANCDSIVTLHLTINNSVEKAITETACEVYKWNDVEYTESGTYQQTFPLATGCDSIVTLTLTITQYDKSDTLKAEMCKTYEWAQTGETYTKPGIYADTIPDVTGASCGTIKYLELTQKKPVTKTIEETACDKFEWDGEILTKSGEYVNTYTAADGCDSVVTLILTINYSAEKTVLFDTACVAYTWSVNNVEYKESTVVSETLKTIHGCDSVVELNLTILQPIVGDTAAEECNMFLWRDVMYYTDTIVYDTIAGAASNGCDSIVKLDLKIGKPFVGELDLIDQYDGRLLMINRTQINKLMADSLDRDNDTALVRWYREAEPEDEFLGYGYYYTKPDGSRVDPGVYYAVVEIPASSGAKCGAKGETQHYAIKAQAGAPALIPSLARPGQDIKVINLDPEQHYTIRIYTTEGILHETYSTNGESTFIIHAANDHGFYLVELSDESMKSTLRYIVK